jgi:wyosine [tRNA(Phe)-imidazoG37] synthetase (radical SAM superfamily)
VLGADENREERSVAYLVFADEKGRIRDHPTLEMGGGSGTAWVRVPDKDLVPLPDGARLFTMPGAHPVGWNGVLETFEAVKEVRRRRATAVAVFLPPGYMRTHLPAAFYPDPLAATLPLWAYTAVGWRDGEFVAAAVRVDSMDHQEPWQYDDRTLLPLIRKRLAEQPGNRLWHQMRRCATEYHCLCAKNGFYRRWEAPLPLAFACNADCVGCISLQSDGLVPASHERVSSAPTLEELCAVALPHLNEAEEAIISFGQGCDGEPLLYGTLIETTIRRVRAQTDRGTIHLNTNGSLPDVVERLCQAGLDTIRVSVNSTQPDVYAAYYRPKHYALADVIASIRRAKACGCYTAINLLVFPGVSDREEEVEGLLRLVAETGLDLIQMKNLNIDPRRYLESIPSPRGRALGMRQLLRTIRRETPQVEIGYFNRPKEHFGRSLSRALLF